MSDEVEITLKLKFHEAIEVLQKISALKTPPRKTTIDQWPYWCWNCKTRILEEKDAVKAHGTLECPSCGMEIPEP